MATTLPSQQNVVVTTQPIATPSASAPLEATLIRGCPPGLEHLAAVSGLYVKQLFEPLEVFVGIETANRYEIFDSNGQRMFFAAEVSHPCVVYLGGRGRPFVIQLTNFFGAPILTLTRHCALSLACGCNTCGGNEVVVTHISGEIIGVAQQLCSCGTPQFELRDGAGQVVFVINGPGGADCCPLCVMGPCCSAEFRVLLPDGVTVVGVIRKQADLRELVSDANTFGISFNVPLLPKLKALILGAVFVIDFGYFESSPNDDTNH